jgi:ABC-type dipeptide/oligopeptide/nickel transport system ATPase subunit
MRQCELQFDAGRGTTMRLSQKPVALARAFLAYALVLILDEATSSLDSESEALIRQAMERLMKGRTAITIAFWFSIAARLSSRVPTPRLSRELAAPSRPVRAPGDGVRSCLCG